MKSCVFEEVVECLVFVGVMYHLEDLVADDGLEALNALPLTLVETFIVVLVVSPHRLDGLRQRCGATGEVIKFDVSTLFRHVLLCASLQFMSLRGSLRLANRSFLGLSIGPCYQSAHLHGGIEFLQDMALIQIVTEAGQRKNFHIIFTA